MDRWEIAKRADIPAGYAIVRTGPIRPDDLLYCWPDGGFMRADSPDWLGPVADDAEHVTLCVRKPTFEDAPNYPNRRTYNLNNRSITPTPALPDPQRSLF